MLECVANFSEGRDRSVIERVGGAAEAVPGVWVLDVHSDADHHRSVLTLVGESAPLIDAMIAATSEAIALIDLQRHEGVHPRIGAMDVVPFVPIPGGSMTDAVDAAQSFAREAAGRLGLPCYLYDHASPDGSTLPDVRRKAVTGMPPDLGPSSHDPSSGAVSVGARGVLVAFNVVLDTRDVGIARAVARSVRSSSGGLPHVRALGLALPSRGLAQVSMNLTSPERTGIWSVFRQVASVAESLGVAVKSSEAVGLVPRVALEGASSEDLRWELPPKVLEDELAQIAEQPDPKKSKGRTLSPKN